MAYNGWENYETWNISLWINNDEPFYRNAVEFMEQYKGARPYQDFIEYLGMGNDETPDGVEYFNVMVDYGELNEMMKELID